MGVGRTQKAFLPALLASLLVAALLASPATAQGPEGEPIYESQEGFGFELYADGTLVTGGDVVGSCEALVREAQPKPLEPEQDFYRELLRQVQACEEAGFRVPGSESLPEAGGPSLPVVAALGLILACGLCRLGTRQTP